MKKFNFDRKMMPEYPHGEKERSAESGCEKYIDDFVHERMNPEQLHEFQEHCEECPDCMQKVIKHYEKIKAEKEKRDIDELFRRTMALIDKLENETKTE